MDKTGFQQKKILVACKIKQKQKNETKNQKIMKQCLKNTSPKFGYRPLMFSPQNSGVLTFVFLVVINHLIVRITIAII